ncbi:hypothetical protein PANA5342_0878 [Pantoea ananatis LMG 5342]|nr:hypothetical protein PANA5342_0878 [Pantoea ananatis LMG 5342]
MPLTAINAVPLSQVHLLTATPKFCCGKGRLFRRILT